MGIYLFNTRTLLEYLKSDALQDTSHDFGKNIIPQMMKGSRVCAYNFKDENKKEAKYWRDVGTIDAYWEANMDLVSVDPLLNLYDKAWPMRTYQGQNPPVKFVFAQEKKGGTPRHRPRLDCCARMHHLRRPGAEFRTLAERPHQQL